MWVYSDLKNISLKFESVGGAVGGIYVQFNFYIPYGLTTETYLVIQRNVLRIKKWFDDFVRYNIQNKNIF